MDYAGCVQCFESTVRQLKQSCECAPEQTGRKGCCFATGVDEGLQALKEGGVPPRLLIVDDGWQSTDLDPDLRPPPSQALQSEHEVLPLSPVQ